MTTHEQTKNIVEPQFDLIKFKTTLKHMINSRMYTNSKMQYYAIYDYICSDIRWMFIKKIQKLITTIKDKLITTIKDKSEASTPKIQNKLIEYAILLGYISPCKATTVKGFRCINNRKTNGYCTLHTNRLTKIQNKLYILNIPRPITQLITDYM